MDRCEDRNGHSLTALVRYQDSRWVHMEQAVEEADLVGTWAFESLKLLLKFLFRTTII